MTVVFGILAAGKGTRIGRVGDSLHKALVPLEGRAVISHLIDLAPPDARIVIALGHRGDQIRDYVALAHPGRDDIGFINVPRWESGGPGHSVLEIIKRAVQPGDDLMFTSCDTLWSPSDEVHEHMSTSWAAVAPIPAGTDPVRWCRLATSEGGPGVTRVWDKRPGVVTPTIKHVYAYTGLAYIVAQDVPDFVHGVQHGHRVEGEVQVSGGLFALSKKRALMAMPITWTDVGDEASYRRAVADRSGYDWTKLDEATYVLKGTRRVVKFMADEDRVGRRAWRAGSLNGLAPRTMQRRNFLAYDYVPGRVAYDVADEEGPKVTSDILGWHDACVMPVNIDDDERINTARDFYARKTLHRIEMLTNAESRNMAFDVVRRIDWEGLIKGTDPVMFHGDFNHGNIIATPGRTFVGIDWREDFAGASWGDRRYDLAKLLSGTVVRWDWAQRGDFRRWPDGEAHAEVIRRDKHYTPDVEIIAALTLLNSAPLHASPMDEILVARGVAWLEEAIG